MKELIKRLERVIQTGVLDKNGQHPISAEVVLEVVKELPEHGTNLASLGTDCISRRAALVALKDALMAWSYMPEWRDEKILEAIAELPTIHLERRGCEEREQGKCPWYAG